MPIPPARSTNRHYPRKPPKPPVETDLKTLGDAANEAARREAAQWFFFLTVMITLAALVGSTTHRVLFLEDPVRVPILGVELPLLGFYVAAPAIFVVLHFYLLAQLKLMEGKVTAFLDAVETETRGSIEHRKRALRRLDSFSVAQLMAEDRFEDGSLPLRLMVSVTLVLAPILLLLFFQIRFLPHHTESITLWHQALVAVDVALLWWLWPFPRGEGARRRRISPAMIGSLAVVGFSWFLAVIPGNDPESRWLNRIRAPLFDGRTNEDTQRPTSPFARRLVLLDQVFLTDAERKTWAETPNGQRSEIARTRVLRARDLRFAELNRADLRGADLTGADLRSADLWGAQLQGAVLVRARLQGAVLRDAQLQGAGLYAAQMQGADLYAAQLQGADMYAAQVQGAVLERAQMQGAVLILAQMQGAVLERVQMQGAVLILAQLQGAVLKQAQMQGTDLSGAQTWRLQAPGAVALEAKPNALAFGHEPPCKQPAGPDGSCGHRAENWRQAVEDWLNLIPRDRRRDAERSFAVLIPPENPREVANAAAYWRQTNPPDLRRVAQFLGDLACGADHAPHMARSVSGQIWSRPPIGRDLENSHRADLAKRMLGSNCPGARGLPPDWRARLAVIADGQD